MRNHQLLPIAANGVYLALLAAAAYFTRATWRRVVGALAGGGVVGLVGVGVDALAYALGWWRYPSVQTPYGPPLVYPAVSLLFAALALLGWRVTRRFGWRGQAVFLGGVAVLGVLRDYWWAARLPVLIVFGSGLVPALADVLCWAGLAALAQAVMRAVAGSVRGDSLARQSEPRARLAPIL